ncbi:MAG: hypothetical protein WCT03_21745 [Candidatus Obscuribacterales bacterium]|jgi:hypothetical protein
MTDIPEKRRRMGATAYKDLFGDFRNSEENQPSTVMSGERLADLLKENFGKIDKNGDGVSLSEIKRAEAMPFNFSEEALLMFKVLEKYFETICNLADDEPGPDTVISAIDVDALAQFLKYSHLTIEQLQEWRKLRAN